MAPGRFTELFFLDEATAFAAGHRPCALCRRADYNRFTAIWADLHPGQPGADAIDAQLHGERVLPGTGERRLHESPFAELPDGAFVLHDDEPHLVYGVGLLNWTTGGYVTCSRLPAGGRATVITPPSLLAILGTGWTSLVPLLHPSAR